MHDYSVYFVKDIASLKLEAPTDTLVVTHDMYDSPYIEGANYISFTKYATEYNNFEPELLVIVGINRMITPSNRCNFVNEYMQTLTPNIKKVVIDTAPFIGEPWRLWFHYSIAHCGKFNISYSYAIETEWKKWFYRETPDCRLAGANIRLFIDKTYSDLDPLTTDFEFYDVDPEPYDLLKEHVFEKYDSPKLIINNLLKQTNKQYGVDIGYETFTSNTTLKLPDLKIYQFVAEEIKRRVDTYNEVVR
jgi:hypothetical protein